MATRKMLAAMVIAVAVVMAIRVTALVDFTVMVRAHGVIKTVGLEVYEDPEATISVDFIDWGTLSPGDLANVTLYLKSTSNVPANLSMVTENWGPEAAATYITLTWTYDHTPLAPEEIRAVTFTLHVAMEISGITDFTFDILITAAV